MPPSIRARYRGEGRKLKGVDILKGMGCTEVSCRSRRSGVGQKVAPSPTVGVRRQSRDSPHRRKRGGAARLLFAASLHLQISVVVKS